MLHTHSWRWQTSGTVFASCALGIAAALITTALLAPVYAATTPLFNHVVVDATASTNTIWSKTTGDYNNDGRDDILIGGASGLFWYENTGDVHTWIEHVIPESGSGTWEGAVSADIDGDGNEDFVSGPNNGLYWFRNLDGGTTWQQYTIDASHTNDALAVADLDNDGDMDIIGRTSNVWNNPNGNTISMWRQDSFNTWTEFNITVQTSGCTGTGATCGEYFSLGDMDNDGDMDIAVDSRWFENPGTITSSWAEHTFTSQWNRLANFSVVADINNDGRNDIVLTPTEKVGDFYKTAWYEAPANPFDEWTEHILENNIETGTHTLQVADIDADGHKDIIVAEMHNTGGDDEIRIYMNEGSGSAFTKEVIDTNGTHWGQLLDADNDGDIDLYGANWQGTQVDLWINETPQQTLSLDNWTYIEVDNSRTERYFGMILSDFENNDGLQEILAGRYYYRNPGGNMTGTWQRSAFPSGTDPLMRVDVDGDALIDMIVMDGSGNVYWYEAVDAVLSNWDIYQIGSFSASDHGISSQGYDVADIIPGGRKEVLIALENGINYFTIPTTNPEAGNWPMVTAAVIPPHGGVHQENFGVVDMDNDGDLDLVGSFDHEDVAWFENPGDGTGNWTSYAVGPTFTSQAHIDRISVADLDSDGDTDIVMGLSNNTINGVYWYESPADPKTGTWTFHTILQQDDTNNIDLADMDNDGDIDIISAEHRDGSNNEEVAIWENDGNANFTKHTVDTGKESHGSALTTDLDGDGDLDIVSFAWDDYQYLHVWRNDAIVAPAADVIDVWNGNTQTFGETGNPQVWVNIPGTAAATVSSLSYTLNGGASVPLTLGPVRRLADSNDFNIDIATSALVDGVNTVVITAQDSGQGQVSETVFVDYTPNVVWSLPYTIDWLAQTNAQDVGDTIDGPWTLDTVNDGLRSSDPAYDRLFGIGDISWTDYEITVPITIHDVDFAGLTNVSGHPGVGVLMRWQGHTDNPVVCAQPKCGWVPHGAIGWWYWPTDTLPGGELTYYQGASTPFAPAIGTTYIFKQRVETQSDGSAIYSMKAWEEGTIEPASWMVTQQNTAIPSGSLALISHHVDATFGDVSIVPVAGADLTPPTVSITTPAEGATVSGTTTVAANASDAIGVDRVEFFVDGALAATDTTAPYTYEWPTTVYANGTQHTLRADAYDTSENVGTSTTITVTVDQTVPVGPAPIAHYEFETGTGTTALDSAGSNHGVITNSPAWVAGYNSNFALDFDGNDDYVDLNNMDLTGNAMSFTLWMNGDNMESQCSTTYRDCRLVSKSTGSAEQDHYWMLSTFKVGNDTSIRWRLKTNGDTDTLIAPNGNLENGTWYHIAAVYDGSTMTLYQDGVQIGQQAQTGNVDTNAAVGAWIARNPDGSRAFNGRLDDVRIYDVALTPQEVIDVMNGAQPEPDTTAPAVSITAPTASSTVAGVVAVSATSSDDVAVDRVEFFVNGGLAATDTTVPYSFDWDTTVVSNGLYTLTAVAYDTSENSASSTITNVLVDNDVTAPVVSNVAATSTTETTGTVTWNTDEAATSQVEYGVTPAMGTFTTLDTNLVTAHSVNVTGLTASTTYYYTVISEDALGNSTTSAQYSFTTAAPAPDTTAPVVNITAPAASSIIAGTVTVIADATDNVAVDRVEFFIDGSLVATDTTAPYAYSWDTTAETDDVHEVRADAYDAAGNSASESISVSVDNTPPPGPTPLMHYLFDEGTGTLAADSAGTTDGTVNGASWVAGQGGSPYALNFDASNDYVDLGTPDVTGSALTIALWMNGSNMEGNCSVTYRDCRLVTKSTNTAEQDHYWMLSTFRNGSNTTLRFRLKTDGDTDTLVAPSGNMQNGTWYHVAAVYDGATMSLYQDGVLIGQQAQTGTLDTNAAVSAWIGRNPNGYGAFGGSLDDVRIYDAALSQTEIAELAGN